MPLNVDSREFREFHDPVLFDILEKIQHRILKHLRSKRLMSDLYAKEYLELHKLQLFSLLEQELAKTQISGYYYLYKKFKASTEDHLSQYLNLDSRKSFLEDLENLKRHLHRYADK